MAVIDVLNDRGETVSQAELDDAIFNVPVKAGLLHEVVRAQLAARRAGNASVKHRSDIKGSTKKLFRQKGTGRARRGDIKSPLLRGGGVVFGPDTKSHGFKLPKKMRRQALKMALSDKLQNNRLAILDRLAMERIKTKDFVAVMKALDKRNLLLITDKKDERIERSSRNIPGVKVLRSEGLNVYDILKYEDLVILEASIEQIQERLGK